ncbi:MAG: ATP-dependent DNA helicase RecG [Clostridiales bacterium]|nr:ATP-dependent DNA helicase RecG [Clostridiales bacterium]
MANDPLMSPVTSIYGVGDQVAKKLSKLGIENVFDLLNYFPRKYEDWSDIKQLHNVNEGELITIKAQVKNVSPISRYDKLQKCVVVVNDGYGTISITFFHGRFVATEMKIGDEYFFRGVVTVFRGGYMLINPQRIRAEKMGEGLIRPVYRQTAGITSKQIEAWIGFALRDYERYLDNILPAKLIKEHDLCSSKEAYRFVHKPYSMAQASLGRQRLVYEELAVYEYGMHKSYNKDDDKGRAFKIVKNETSQKTVKAIIGSLPFELTDDQKSAIRDIFVDISKDKPMNRLIQGDVGSGKTAVAAIAMAAVAASGRQAALLAPTGVLAKQHYETVVEMYEGTDIKAVYLHGGMKASEKKDAIKKISDGTYKIIIGTHAIIQKDVKFRDLALFITDEQQRFGVEQRNEKLKLAFINSDIDSVHSLVMSATPIPRTLAMVVYGDMDISIIRQKPKGRKPIKTKVWRDKPSIYNMISKIVRERGQQVYIVAPRIDDNDDAEIERYENIFEVGEEKIETQSVKGILEEVKASPYLQGITADTLVGSMSDSKKAEVMERFISGETKILISTTVVEVGVNNPNATLMVVMDADRFGLSTLHQLRGRVGRSSLESFCVLETASQNELSLQRLDMMCKSNDGFVLAEQDLALRGPGDFFGTRQHGLPSFKVVNLFEDTEKSVEIRDVMSELMKQDDDESKRVLNAIERQLMLRYPNLEVFRA